MRHALSSIERILGHLLNTHLGPKILLCDQKNEILAANLDKIANYAGGAFSENR